MHDWSGILRGIGIGAGGVVVVLWTCLRESAAEPPVDLPGLTPAQTATSERWSLPCALTGVVPLPVEGLRLFARNYISEERLKVAWHAGTQAGKFAQGQLDHLDRVQKPFFAGRKLQNHFWVLVSGKEPGIYDRWGDVSRRPHRGRSWVHCAWPSIAEASAYWQGALLAKRRRLSGE